MNAGLITRDRTHDDTIFPHIHPNGLEMREYQRMRRHVAASTALFLIVLSGIGISSEQVKRLDLFDAQGNHLMFVDFEYDQTGKNTGRSVYMSDSTFVRTVAITRDAQGGVSKETSFNFNDDTVFSTTYSSNGDTKSITVRDLFGMDQLGAPVSYRTSGDNNFTISQKGVDINKMGYEFNGQGDLEKVSVTDNSGTLLYYGLFSYGTGINNQKNIHYQKPNISLRGNTLMAARFTLNRPAEVRCELIALNGRRSGVLFAALFPPGTHRKNMRIHSTSCFASKNGIYLVTLSIEGIIVASSRQVILRSGL